MTNFDIYSVFKINKKNRADFIVTTLIFVMPFLFYTYNLIPKVKIWNTWFFEFNSGEYDDVRQFVWYLSIKLLTLGILSIWYLTCVNNWKVVLFIPIVIEISKIIYLIKSLDAEILHQFFVVESLYFSIPYIILLQGIKLNLFDDGKNKNYNVELNKEISNEFIELSNFNKNNYKFVKKELSSIRKEKNTISQKEYLVKLIELRDRLVI